MAGGSFESSLKPGDTVEGRYRIVKMLDQGGMGTVFLAEHVLIQRRVALKVLRPEYAENADVLDRFMKEARAAGTLGHPNIVESTDMGFTREGVPYIVFEYLEGSVLSDEVYRVGGMAVRRAVRIARQITSALSAAHAAGVVHRDLKSDNVFLTDREEASDHVKVIDFGISRFLEAEDERSSARNTLMGTPQFMAPEQIMTPDSVDQRADIYALGVIVYEMLTARRPFQNDDAEALLHSIVNDPPPPLERPDAPPGLEEMLFTRLLAKDREQRYQSMKDVEAALEAFAGILREGRDSQPIPVASRPVDHEASQAAKVIALPAPKRAIGGMALLASAVLAGAAGAALMVLAPTPEPDGRMAAARTALQGEVDKLASTFDDEARAAHLRVDGLAQAPQLRAAIETDTATLKDMLGSDFRLTLAKGEILEIFQLRDGGARVSLLRMPQTASPIELPTRSQARIATDGKTTSVIVAAPVTRQDGAGLAGTIALAVPIDLSGIEQRIAPHAAGAIVTGVGLSIPLVDAASATGATIEVKTTAALSAELGGGQLELTAQVPQPAPPTPPLGYRLAGYASWGTGGALLLIYAVLLLRGRRRR